MKSILILGVLILIISTSCHSSTTRKTSFSENQQPDGQEKKSPTHQPKLTRKTVVTLYRSSTRLVIMMENEIFVANLDLLCEKILEHNKKYPEAYYEFESEIKLGIGFVKEIREAFQCAGVRVWHFWVPISAVPEGVELRQDGKLDLGPS